MKRYSLFLFLSLFCGAILLITAENLFSQRGMKISIRTPKGEEIPLYKDSYALVVGNGNYTNGWNPLDGALQDVKEVKTTLEKHGFHVTLKTDLNAAAFRRAFAEFVLKSGKDRDNRLLFYYAGHGYTRKSATNDDLGYLVMVEAPLPQTDDVGFELESIDMESLVTQAEKILARHALFVFDSCFSGTILNMRDEQKPPESISDSIKYPVRQFITAGRAGETVPDNSAFKQALLNLLEGRADEPFPDGYITGEELGFYLQHKVPEYNAAQHPQYGKIRNPKLDQGDFVFVLPQEKVWTPPPQNLSPVAVVTVTSTPSGADVYLDNVHIGKTPLRRYEIDTGARREKQVRVALSLSGYKSSVQQLTLRGGQPAVLQNVRLEKIVSRNATLRVTSTPSQATVYVDGVRVGKTPLDNYKVDTGVQRQKRIEVGLELSGYKSRVAKLALKGGQTTPWDVRLEKPPPPKPTPKPALPIGSIPEGMVLIPAGEFQMGSNAGEDDEKPVHTVYVDAFYMDKYEVTNAQYKKFVDANPEWRKDRIPRPLHNNRDYLKHWRGNTYPTHTGNHPVVYVSWYAAMAYAKWAGKRLPTEAEWEKAARGSLVGKKYPWGNTIDRTKAKYYYYESKRRTRLVGSYPPNGYGLYDMAGNVYEWCLDEYDSDFYSNSPRANPIGGTQRIDILLDNYENVKLPRVLRGGAWSSSAHFMRCAQRRGDTPAALNGLHGFRCARAATP